MFTLFIAELAGKIPMVSLIHQISGPQQNSYNESSSNSSFYPSITPFVPTPDVMTNRYCQVEVVNKGACPLCESQVLIKSTSEVENIWQIEYDGSEVLDWEPLVSNGDCLGIVLKVVSWDEIADVHELNPGSIAVNQRTTRSSFGNADDDDNEETDDTEEEFSGVGEVETEMKKISDINISPYQYWLQGVEPGRKRTSRFTDVNDRSNTIIMNKVASHVRHKHMLHSKENSKDNSDYHKVSSQISKQADNDYFEHPTIHVHNGRQSSARADSEELGFSSINSPKHRSNVEKKSYGKEKMSPKMEALYSKEGREEEKQIERNIVEGDFRHSALDFELPINVFGLPIDTQPPEGFSLQRLTEYIFLVHYNGSDWVDVPLKKTPIFQLCKGSVCIPNEKYANKLGK